MTPREILYTAAVPFVVALAALLVAWRPWRRRERAVVRGAWGGPLGIGAGFLAAFALLEGRLPGWPPAEARHWLFYFVAALTLLGVAEALLHAWRPGAGWMRAEAALCVFAAGLFLLFQSMLRNEAWTAFDATRRVLGMLVLVHAAWAASEVLVLRLPRPAGPLVLAVFSGAAGLVVMLSGSVVYGRLAGTLAVGALAAGAVSVGARGFSLARGAVTVIVPAAVSILLVGHHYVDPGVTGSSIALLLVALVLPWIALVRPLRRRPPWVRAVLAAGLAAVPAGIAVLLAYRSFSRMQQETGPGAADEPGAYSFHAATGGR
jgi:hypothetical protein